MRLVVWRIALRVGVVGVVLEGRVLIVIEGRILVLHVRLVGRSVIGVVVPGRRRWGRPCVVEKWLIADIRVKIVRHEFIVKAFVRFFIKSSNGKL